VEDLADAKDAGAINRGHSVEGAGGELSPEVPEAEDRGESLVDGASTPEVLVGIALAGAGEGARGWSLSGGGMEVVALP